MIGPPLPLKMLQAFISRSGIKLARKEYTVFEQLKGAPRPPPRAVFLFKAQEEYIFIKIGQVRRHQRRHHNHQQQGSFFREATVSHSVNAVFLNTLKAKLLWYSGGEMEIRPLPALQFVSRTHCKPETAERTRRSCPVFHRL